MPSMSQKVERNKVGDTDPAARAAFKRELEKAKRPIAAPAPVTPPKKAAMPPAKNKPPLDTERRARQIEGQLKKLGV